MGTIAVLLAVFLFCAGLYTGDWHGTALILLGIVVLLYTAAYA